MAKLEIRITQIYRRGKRGFSKGLTIEGSELSLKRVYNQLEEQFAEVRV